MSAEPVVVAVDAEIQAPLDISVAYADSNIGAIIDRLDRELIGLAPVKSRIREIAALLLVDRLRKRVGLDTEPPPLHMSFTGGPGTGKTTVAMRMAEILKSLGYVRKGHLIAVTRDDLVGQFIGHTAPKTKEVIKRAMGGVLFIDEAYYLYKAENERDYGGEAIEILLQAMENNRDDLVVIFAGYKDRMNDFFSSNPGLKSRVGNHIDFPDYSPAELMQIGTLMVDKLNYRLTDAARGAFAEYIERRMEQPFFGNARSVRNAIGRARLRQANRLFARGGVLTRDELMTIEADDIRKSRIFDEASEASLDS
jgi:probable Rubsico expression protein CbbX